MTGTPRHSPRKLFHQFPLRSLFAIVAIACILFALTRPSIVASVMVVIAVLLALASIVLPRIRGEIVVALIFGIPLLVLAIGHIVAAFSAG